MKKEKYHPFEEISKLKMLFSLSMSHFGNVEPLCAKYFLLNGPNMFMGMWILDL